MANEVESYRDAVADEGARRRGGGRGVDRHAAADERERYAEWGGGVQVAASPSQCGPAATGDALAGRNGGNAANEVGENGSACKSRSACEHRRRGESEGDRRFKTSAAWATGKGESRERARR
jgi:hypothetical protein